MNKKLLAASIGLMFAGAAHAQTAVTLYGIADGDFRVDHTSIGTLKSVGSGGESGTRWGLRGTEDLGDGLKATFNFEQGFDLSDNSVTQGNITPTTPTSPTSSTGSRLFSRTATVGLNSTAFGEGRFGRAYTPFYVLWTSIDPMGGRPGRRCAELRGRQRHALRQLDLLRQPEGLRLPVERRVPARRVDHELRRGRRDEAGRQFRQRVADVRGRTGDRGLQLHRHQERDRQQHDADPLRRCAVRPEVHEIARPVLHHAQRHDRHPEVLCARA